jgi:hypothetical protein
MKSIRVQVEYNDIMSECHGAYNCPISSAIAKHGLEAGVTHERIQITERIPMGWGHKTIYKSYYMPPLMRDWVKAYDNGNGVLPIEFTLNLDNPYNIKEKE